MFYVARIHMHSRNKQVRGGTTIKRSIQYGNGKHHSLKDVNGKVVAKVRFFGGNRATTQKKAKDYYNKWFKQYKLDSITVRWLF